MMDLGRHAAQALTRSTLFQTFLKPALKRTLWPEGATRTILRGPSRGLRYRIFPGYGWSPLYGGWEPRVQALMVEHLSANGVAYDVGANYGIHALLMARITQAGGGSVHAFEPFPEIMSELRRNVAINGFEHVTFVTEALSNVTGETTFFTGAHGGAGHIASVAARDGAHIGRTTTVKTITLDEYVTERGNPAPTFIKMDVEGAESSVLAGGQRVLAAARPVLLMDLHGIDQEIAVGRALRELGYRIHRVDDGRPVLDVDHGHDHPNGMSDEILALPSRA
jgi:FkbM family methyltransferase